MQNARSRFLKSKSTTALFDQNTPSKIEGNITALLGKAKTLEDSDIPAGYGEHHSAAADAIATPITTANETADVDTNHNATENDVAASQTKDTKSFPKLKKIPSFSEKLVETLVASQAAGMVMLSSFPLSSRVFLFFFNLINPFSENGDEPSKQGGGRTSSPAGPFEASPSPSH